MMLQLFQQKKAVPSENADFNDRKDVRQIASPDFVNASSEAWQL